MVPLIAPVVAELGIELVPVVLYGGYKVAEFANKGGFKVIKNMAKIAYNKSSKNENSKVKK